MTLPTALEPFDIRLTTWMARNGIPLVRIAMGVVYTWFGALKFIPGWSPAGELATRTIEQLTFGFVGPSLALPLLATWEVLIGLGLLTGRLLRITLLLLFVQIPGTMLPLFFYPGETFTRAPFAPTLEGQYIIKNVVLVSAAIVLGATVRGGELVPEPVVATQATTFTGRPEVDPEP